MFLRPEISAFILIALIYIDYHSIAFSHAPSTHHYIDSISILSLSCILAYGYKDYHPTNYHKQF